MDFELALHDADPPGTYLWLCEDGWLWLLRISEGEPADEALAPVELTAPDLVKL